MEKTNEELMKAIADVLDEALQEYEKLSKGEGIDAAEHVDEMKGQTKGVVGEGTAPKPMMAKEEDAKEKDKDEDDDKLMETYKSVVAKMEARGLMAKMDKPKKEMKKSETEEAPAVVEAPKVDATESLRKSVDERFETLTKALKEVADNVKKIAATPVARKGVTGLKPLMKSEGEEAPALKKGEIVNKLLELRKNNDGRVDSLLINRVETNRLTKSDIERIKALGILAE